MNNHYQDKKDFHSNLRMKDITDADDKQGGEFGKNWNNKSKGEYLNLYVQSKTLLLANVIKM